MRANAARILSLHQTAGEIAAKCGKTTADTLSAMLAIERHTERSARASERSTNGPTYCLHWEKIEQREADQAEEIAATLGLKTDWPGLYPFFTDAAGHPVRWDWGN